MKINFIYCIILLSFTLLSSAFAFQLQGQTDSLVSVNQQKPGYYTIAFSPDTAYSYVYTWSIDVPGKSTSFKQSALPRFNVECQQCMVFGTETRYTKVSQPQPGAPLEYKKLATRFIQVHFNKNWNYYVINGQVKYFLKEQKLQIYGEKEGDSERD